MVQTLAIRGHYYSGNKVIALLRSLGGNNTKGYDGSKIDYFYYINSNGDIDCILQDNMLITQWETHSLDSFNKEYPYKTFDKFVLYGKEASICETFWNGFTIKRDHSGKFRFIILCLCGSVNRFYFKRLIWF